MITEAQIQEGLKARLFGKKIYTFESLDSTNDCAKTLAACGIAEGTVIFAEHQTGGRGRMGRSWESQPGQNILLSIILRPTIEQENISLMTYYIAASAAETIERFISTSVECKWPNDLLLNGKKFCGILLESSFQQQQLDFVVAGIGINVNQTAFPQPLRNKATSLKLEFGDEFDRAKIIQELLTQLQKNCSYVRNHNFEPLLKKWRQRCTMFGKLITVAHNGTSVSGKAFSLEANGALLLETTDGIQKFYAGDVSLLNEVVLQQVPTRS